MSAMGRINADQPSFLCGLIGAGIQGSLTPAMHEREGDEQGFRLIYKKIDLTELGLGVADLPDLVTAAERMGFAGLNITHPAKQAIIPLLDRLSPEAEALGAVNTVVFADGKRIGHNTDWWGFAENLCRNMRDVRLGHVVQFGAGGAGAAVAFALMWAGVEKLTIVDVDVAKAEALAANLAARFSTAAIVVGSEEAVKCADGIVNTTPVGMAKYPGIPLTPGLLRPDLWVADIVYFPIETALLKAARAVGAPALDGGGMAVFQAVKAFELITGHPANAERMLRHFQSLGTVSVT